MGVSDGNIHVVFGARIFCCCFKAGTSSAHCRKRGMCRSPGWSACPSWRAVQHEVPFCSL